MTPRWGFGVAMLPVGALCIYQAHFGRTVLPKWPFWALFYSVFYSVSELRRACFRQARVARAVLPPGALFRARAIALPPCAPKSHTRPLPHLGFLIWGRPLGVTFESLFRHFTCFLFSVLLGRHPLHNPGAMRPPLDALLRRFLHESGPRRSRW